MTRRELFLRYVAQTSELPMLGVDIDVESANGVWLITHDGKKYLDFISGISVSSLGHSHPAVTKAIREQLKKYTHLMVFGEFNQSPQAEYASSLCSRLPETLDSVFFTSGGSEATEGALKLAKRATGRYEVVSFTDAYHGSTSGALSVCGNEMLKNAFRPLMPDIKVLRFNDHAELEWITRSTAAVIIEVVQGEAGVRPAEEKFLHAVRQKCNETGSLLIFDEIQTGFGRTGHLFCFMKYGITPDILLAGKAMGGGLPAGAFIASSALMSELGRDPALGHINTFGGNALCIAAAGACLRVLTRKKMADAAAFIGNYIGQRLRHPLIAEIRSVGAMIALEFNDETLNFKVIKKCLEKGLIADWFLFCPTAMRIAPPLIITEEELNEACGIILSALDEIA
jgi:acetylornithine/N-succinyldiaminopimelate aminotransferase